MLVTPDQLAQINAKFYYSGGTISLRETTITVEVFALGEWYRKTTQRLALKDLDSQINDAVIDIMQSIHK